MEFRQLLVHHDDDLHLSFECLGMDGDEIQEQQQSLHIIDYNNRMDRKSLPELLLQSSRQDQVKVFIRTHPSVKYQHNSEETLEGNLTIL